MIQRRESRIRAWLIRAQATAATIGASALLTMSLFDTMPERVSRIRPAIVREHVIEHLFDPREVLANGIVLTLPLTIDQSSEHRTGAITFSAN